MHVSRIVQTIAACCILHNICIDINDEYWESFAASGDDDGMLVEITSASLVQRATVTDDGGTDRARDRRLKAEGIAKREQLKAYVSALPARTLPIERIQEVAVV